MSSKRGRKRNDNLPPNRARDVQRAFRARRAAHLQALEERVTELEDENDQLRAALNLPPASRPLLGRGPTGKDKPKMYNARSSMSQGSSVVGEGSCSPRTSSSSPHSATLTMNSVAHSTDSDLAGGSWDHALSMPGHDDYSDRESMQASAMSSAASYSSEPHFRFDVAPQSSSRSSGAMYMAQGGSGAYPHSSDRPATSSSSFSARDDTYNFPSSSMSPSHTSSGSMGNFASNSMAQQPHHHLDGSMNGADAHSPSAPMLSHSSAPPNVAYSLRRSITEPQHFPSYVDSFPPVPYVQQAHVLARQPQRLSSPSNRLPPARSLAPQDGYGGHEAPAVSSPHRPS